MARKNININLNENTNIFLLYEIFFVFNLKSLIVSTWKKFQIFETCEFICRHNKFDENTTATTFIKIQNTKHPYVSNVRQSCK